VTLHREIKGLDLVRRDWCDLSKDISSIVLDKILSETNKEIVDDIHTYLQQIGAKIRNGEIHISKFVINKSLTKAPTEYADAKSQPHVQVALRMKAKGESTRIGDTIPYVIAQGENPIVAQRAFHPDDFSKGELKIDIDWYMKQQVHPPVARLCEHIEGTDIAQIADCLGLEAAKYVHIDKEKEYHKFYKNENIPPVPQGEMIVTVRNLISKYYEGWLVCDDPTCNNRTRDQSVISKKCLVNNCRGTVHPEFTESTLYAHLLAYQKTDEDARRFLTKNGFAFVDLQSIFNH